MILTAIGWIATLGLLALAASSARHGIRDKARGPWIAAGLYACGAVIMLAVDGILSALPAAVLAFLAIAVAGAVAVVHDRADAVAAQSREILRTIKTQMQIAGQSKRGLPQEIIDFSEK